MDLKNIPGKQSKIENIHYEKLEIQPYLLEGNKNTEISQVIFKARGKMLDIKDHKKWKYSDQICVGCDKNTETVEELLVCPGFCEEGEIGDKTLAYSTVYGKSVDEMINIAKVMRKRLKVREKLIEGKNCKTS